MDTSVVKVPTLKNETQWPVTGRTLPDSQHGWRCSQGKVEGAEARGWCGASEPRQSSEFDSTCSETPVQGISKAEKTWLLVLVQQHFSSSPTHKNHLRNFPNVPPPGTVRPVSSLNCQQLPVETPLLTDLFPLMWKWLQGWMSAHHPILRSHSPWFSSPLGSLALLPAQTLVSAFTRPGPPVCWGQCSVL
jgi:hypothetical protein